MKFERWKVIVWVGVILGFIMVNGASAAESADEPDRAVVAEKAEAFMEGFGAELHATNYQQVGQRAKKLVSKEAFVAQSSIVRQQVGGEGLGRRVIDYRRAQQMPGPHGMIYGEFSFVRFATRYPVGQMYEDIYLEKEADDEWRVVGWWVLPAPG